MPVTSAKQEHFLQAVAHGWKPSHMKTTLSAHEAKKMLSAEDRKVKARKAGQMRALQRL